MPLFEDLQGHTFGKLTVVQLVCKADARKNSRWLCRCDCGEMCIRDPQRIKGGLSACSACHRSKRDSQIRRAGEPLLGHQFGEITVTGTLGPAEDSGLTGRDLILEGRCSCGNDWRGRAAALRNGSTLSCAHCQPRGPKPFPDRESVALRSLLTTYQTNARNKARVWGLSERQFYGLLGGNCHYCDAPPGNVASKRARKGRRTGYQVTYNGIDRKDNDKGYTPENSVSCCKVCNYAKRELEHDQFLAHITMIYRNMVRRQFIQEGNQHGLIDME